MKKSGEKPERRGHERFRAKENVFAAIKRDNIILCKVADISKGGVLFFSEDLDAIDESTLIVDIYIDNEVYVRDVPVKVISDFTTQNAQVFDGFPIRYLRLAFEDLSTAQKDRLMKILQIPDAGP